MICGKTAEKASDDTSTMLRLQQRCTMLRLLFNTSSYGIRTSRLALGPSFSLLNTCSGCFPRNVDGAPSDSMIAFSCSILYCWILQASLATVSRGLMARLRVIYASFHNSHCILLSLADVNLQQCRVGSSGLRWGHPYRS